MKRWLLGVAGLALVLYLPSLTHPLINWDDGSVIAQAGRLLPLTGESLRWLLTSFELSTWQPLAWLVYAGLFKLGGPSPFPYHAFSWLLHAAACASYFLIARRLLGKDLLAALAALLFAWHPLQVESVAAAASIADMLAVTLALASVAAYAYDRDRVSLGLFVLAGLSRWQAFVVPVALVAVDAARGRKLWDRRKLPFVAVAAALVCVYAGVKAEQHSYGRVAARPREAAYGLLFYAAKWLVPANLLPVYMLHEYAAGPAGTAALAAAPGLALIVLVLARRAPGLAGAAAVYAAALAPTLLLTGDGDVYGHDRYAYLACAGFPLAAAWAANRAGRTGLVALGLAAGAFGAAAARQLDVWSSPRAFWEHALSVRPEWPLALDRLGEALLGEGRTREAIATFKRAERFAPAAARGNLSFAYANLGIELAQAGKLEEAEAAFDQSLRLNPVLPNVAEYRERVRRARRASGTPRSGSGRSRRAKAS